jgi:Predicted signal transduction protein with a C-terminal ATPase domain
MGLKRGNKRFVSFQVKVFAMIIVLVMMPVAGMEMFFYYQNSKAVSEKVTLSNMNTINQIGVNLEYIMNDVKQNSLLLYQNGDVRNFLQADSLKKLNDSHIRLNKSIPSILASQAYPDAIDICRLDGQQYQSTSDYSGISPNQMNLILKQTGKMTFLGVSESKMIRGKSAYIFSRKINDVNNLSVTLGMMEIYVDKSRIMDLFSNIPLAEKNSYFIVQNGTVVISPEEQYVGKSISTLVGDYKFQQKTGNSVLSLNGQKDMLTYYHLGYPDWYLVNLVSMEQIGRENSMIVQTLLFTALLAFVVCSILAYWMSAHLLSPLKSVAQSMKNLEKENFHITVPVKGNDEISVLAGSFNKMSVRLDELVNQVHTAQLREKDAQIQTLQAYINPHFLYNTLDTICWMSRMEEAYETCRLVEALSKLFRMSVQNNRKVVSVSVELEYTRNYLMIQECRYSDSIDFVIRSEPGLEHCETVNFVLQPLIENAILHGFQSQDGGGTIAITVCRDGDRLVYMVEDNGQGADVSELEALVQNYTEGERGMAVSGVNSRIQFRYGKQYGLHFFPVFPHGLKAVVEQPYIDIGGQQDDYHDDRR